VKTTLDRTQHPENFVKTRSRDMLLSSVNRRVLLYKFWLVENQLQTTPTSGWGPA